MTPSEDSSAIKARSRPRALNKPSEALLIAPPDVTPPRDVTSRDQAAMSRDQAAMSRDVTSRDGVMRSRDTSDLDVRVKRHSVHSSPQVGT